MLLGQRMKAGTLQFRVSHLRRWYFRVWVTILNWFWRQVAGEDSCTVLEEASTADFAFVRSVLPLRCSYIHLPRITHVLGCSRRKIEEIKLVWCFLKRPFTFSPKLYETEAKDSSNILRSNFHPRSKVLPTECSLQPCFCRERNS